MSRFVLYIDTDGAAFDPAEGHELARILRGLAARAEQTGRAPEQVLRDRNGNRVGGTTLRREEDTIPCIACNGEEVAP